MSPQLYFLAFLLGLYAPYFVWAMLALLALAEDRAWDDPLSEPAQGWPLVTVAVPMYNEGDQFMACIDAMLSIEYPNLEVVVVNDGSSDHSFEVARERYGVSALPSEAVWPDRGQPLVEVYRSERYPRLHIYNQPNSGKAGALNTALRFARGKYFLTLDADSIPGRFSLKRLVMALERQPRLVGASGIVRLANGCRVHNGEIEQVRLARSWLLRFQTLEYLRAFLIARIGMSVSGGLIILSGAFAMLRTDKLRAVGGFDQQRQLRDHDAELLGGEFRMHVRVEHQVAEAQFLGLQRLAEFLAGLIDQPIEFRPRQVQPFGLGDDLLKLVMGDDVQAVHRGYAGADGLAPDDGAVPDAHAGHIGEVLDRHRQAGKGAALAQGPLHEPPGMGAGPVEAQGGQRVDGAIHSRHPAFQRIEAIERGNLPLFQPVDDVDGGHPDQVGHASFPRNDRHEIRLPPPRQRA